MKSFFLFLFVGMFMVGFLGCDKSPSRILGVEEYESDTVYPSEKPVAGDTSTSSVELLEAATVGAISTSLNTAFVGGTAGSPNGVFGQQNVKIASFVISSGENQLRLEVIVLKNSSISGLGLGSYAQNLRLVGQSEQIGNTIGSLSEDPSDQYTFQFNGQSKMPARSRLITDVFVDFKSGAKVSSAPFSGIVLDHVSAQKLDKKGRLLRHVAAHKDVPAQKLVVVPNGSFASNLSADNPVSGIRKMWVIGEEVLAIKLSAMDEDVSFSRIIASVDILQEGATPETAASTYYDFIWYDGAVALNAPVQIRQPSLASPYVDVNFRGADVVVAKNTSKTLRLKPRTNMPQYASSGAVFRFSIRAFPLSDGATPGITARGMSSAAALIGPDCDIVGSYFVVRANYPVMESLQLPSGQALRLNQPQTVLYKWKVTAQSSWSGSQNGVMFKKIPFDLKIMEESVETSTLALSNFRIKRNGQYVPIGDYEILSPDPNDIGRALELSGEDALVNNAQFLTTFIFVIFRSNQFIAASESVIYELLADVIGGGTSSSQDGDAIAIRIAAESEPVVITGSLEPDLVPYSVYSVGGVRSMMIWSDMTSSSPGLPISWTNGWLVRTSEFNTYLPSPWSIILP